jgi:hypothetical protein
MGEKMRSSKTSIVLAFCIFVVLNFNFGCGTTPIDLDSVSRKTDALNTPTPISKTGSKLIHEIPGRTRGIVRGELVNQEGVRWNKMTPPKVWLEFNVEQGGSHESAEMVKVEMPEGAKVIIDDFWHFWIKRDDLKSSLLKLNHTRYNLHQVEIETPAGKRPISLDEAKDLVDFLTDSAALVNRSR